MYYQVWLPEILHRASRVFFRVCCEFYNKQIICVNWLVFIMQMECVYCAVGTTSFDIVQVKFLLQCIKCMFPFTPGLPMGFWFRITVFVPCVLHVPIIAPSLIWNFVNSIHILKASVYIFFFSGLVRILFYVQIFCLASSSQSSYCFPLGFETSFQVL